MATITGNSVMTEDADLAFQEQLREIAEMSATEALIAQISASEALVERLLKEDEEEKEKEDEEEKEEEEESEYDHEPSFLLIDAAIEKFKEGFPCAMYEDEEEEEDDEDDEDEEDEEDEEDDDDNSSNYEFVEVE
ncbi:MAG: hypothetical protein Terrestrivirus5_156 [Terrestrivirus sp.]|uniref:Uncharacterized protein n=1 Tax=Terrestrivirus sp. TaxID=2487775 RepID=A0A3G4ZPR6_9VIRU|nr:MAG: hypothetical protein Terrestrivirus5_156 [Terrestrivirus sp.]